MDSRSKLGQLSRGNNIYKGGSTAAQRGGGPQYGRPSGNSNAAFARRLAMQAQQQNAARQQRLPQQDLQRQRMSQQQNAMPQRDLYNQDALRQQRQDSMQQQAPVAPEPSPQDQVRAAMDALMRRHQMVQQQDQMQGRDDQLAMQDRKRQMDMEMQGQRQQMLQDQMQNRSQTDDMANRARQQEIMKRMLAARGL